MVITMFVHCNCYKEAFSLMSSTLSVRREFVLAICLEVISRNTLHFEILPSPFLYHVVITEVKSWTKSNGTIFNFLVELNDKTRLSLYCVCAKWRRFHSQIRNEIVSQNSRHFPVSSILSATFLPNCKNRSDFEEHMKTSMLCNFCSQLFLSGFATEV